jgi:micrococcal nuclease
VVIEMKKILFTLFCFFFISNVSASERIDVKLKKCVDGDTAYFIYNNKEIKTRFLAIDTPESTKEIEKYGPEASEYTCKLLKEAKNIELEYDSNSDKQDKYDRHLVWVFIDDKLLQEEIIKEGLAEVAYLYDEYKYTDRLIQAQDEAKKEGKNLWMEEETTPDYIIIIILTLAIIAFILKEKTK